MTNRDILASVLCGLLFLVTLAAYLFTYVGPRVYAGFIVSMVVFIGYWSSTLSDGAITRRIGEHGLRFFGSVPRIAVTHSIISFAIGLPFLILDSDSLLGYLMMNFIGMPMFLIVGVHFILKPNRVEIQLAVWKHPASLKKGALDEGQFVRDLSRLVQGTTNIHRLEFFFKAYVDLNPTMVPALRTAIQGLENDNKIPSDLSVFLDGLWSGTMRTGGGRVRFLPSNPVLRTTLFPD